MKILFVVASDLARREDGTVTIGPETKIVCDRAIELAKKCRGSIIVASAGRAGSRWNNVWMAKAMSDYIVEPDLSCPVVALTARTFNTWGEMEALAAYIKEDLIMFSRELMPERVTIVVKWWHAPRSAALCKYWLRRYGLGRIPVEIEECRSNASWTAISKEFLLATPRNWLRMMLGKLPY